MEKVLENKAVFLENVILQGRFVTPRGTGIAITKTIPARPAGIFWRAYRRCTRLGRPYGAHKSSAGACVEAVDPPCLCLGKAGSPPKVAQEFLILDTFLAQNCVYKYSLNVPRNIFGLGTVFSLGSFINTCQDFGLHGQYWHWPLLLLLLCLPARRLERLYRALESYIVEDEFIMEGWRSYQSQEELVGGAQCGGCSAKSEHE